MENQGDGMYFLLFFGLRLLMLVPPEHLERNVRAAAVSTLILRAPGETELEELKHVVDSALSMLTTMSSTPLALPGGG